MADEIDIRRIRLGYAVLGLVLLAAIVVMVVVSSGTIQVLMLAIVLFTLVRLYLVLRANRRGR